MNEVNGLAPPPPPPSAALEARVQQLEQELATVKAALQTATSEIEVWKERYEVTKKELDLTEAVLARQEEINGTLRRNIPRHTPGARNRQYSQYLPDTPQSPQHDNTESIFSDEDWAILTYPDTPPSPPPSLSLLQINAKWDSDSTPPTPLSSLRPQFY